MQTLFIILASQRQTIKKINKNWKFSTHSINLYKLSNFIYVDKTELFFYFQNEFFRDIIASRSKNSIRTSNIRDFSDIFNRPKIIGTKNA